MWWRNTDASGETEEREFYDLGSLVSLDVRAVSRVRCSDLAGVTPQWRSTVCLLLAHPKGWQVCLHPWWSGIRNFTVLRLKAQQTRRTEGGLPSPFPCPVSLISLKWVMILSGQWAESCIQPVESRVTLTYLKGQIMLTKIIYWIISPTLPCSFPLLFTFHSISGEKKDIQENTAL